MSFQSQNPFSSEFLFTCSLHYVLHLLNIILTFAHLSWQVPRSSVGRALYRESGPSQDGDPDPGKLPFFFFFSFFAVFFFFFDDLLIFPFYKKAYKYFEVFFYIRLFTSFINDLFVPHIGKFTLFLNSKIEDINRNAAQTEP